MTCKLGLDTGGTYTDAVLCAEDVAGASDNSQVLAHAKSHTTHHDLSIGLRAATARVLEKADDTVSLVSLSTTLATNALVEGRGRRVCLILIGYTPQQLKRARLADALGGDPMGFIEGGHNASGHEAAALDMPALQTLVREHANSVEAFAVSAMFGVRNPAHEIAARDWIRQETSKPVSCGFELSSGLDAPRRALTAILNARLIPLIENLLSATTEMLEDFGIKAPLMVVKGDGSLVSAGFAARSPVETILSGPAASVVGAQFLSGERELVVSDMGGTTTDIALLRDGKPRIDPNGATVGGWETMVEAVRINTYGLGGDSAVLFDREARDFTIGPHRVMPLCVFVQQYPQYQSVLEAQLELPFTTTHSAQFVFNNRKDKSIPAALTGQQKELWARIVDKPIAVQTLFEDQTLERALQKLLVTGHVMMAGFTPSDACLIGGTDLAMPVAGNAKDSGWHRDASVTAAKLLMRYSEFNLGASWPDELAFALAIREKVSRLSAMAILETVLIEDRARSRSANAAAVARKSRASAKAGQLPHQQRELLEETFAMSTQHMNSQDGDSQSGQGSGSVSLSANLRQPVIGLGAPAISYYQRVAELLHTSADVPEFAGVANALGAVVGTVSQSRTLTITPVGGKRVQVHAETGPEEFPDLEAGAEWAQSQLQEAVRAQAVAAGAVEVETVVDRRDTVVDNDGERVFFESTITVSSSGRPATLSDS